MDDAHRYLAEVYRPAHNTEFMQLAAEEGSSFMSWGGSNLDDILCEQYGRTVTADNPDLIGTLTVKLFKSRRTGIDAITSRSRCVFIGTRTALLPFFTARGSWLIMPGVDNYAHLGGFVGGLGAAYLLNPLKRGGQRDFIFAVICLLATIFSVLYSVLNV